LEGGTYPAKYHGWLYDAVAEIERLQLENNKLHTECGHLQADKEELRQQCDAIRQQRAEAESDAAWHRRQIEAHNLKLSAVPSLGDSPASPEEGLRFLAVWFDAMYPDDPDTQVQDDLRRWANEIERLREALLCEDCGGTGWVYCATADTSTTCRSCQAHKIRMAAKAGGGDVA
jgi:hypothetical protein